MNLKKNISKLHKKQFLSNILSLYGLIGVYGVYGVFSIGLIVLLPIGLFAQAAPTGSSATLVSFLPMVAIFAIMYFLLIRPQMKANKERQKMVAGVKRGDKILTSGGLYGTIINIRGDVLDLKLAENLKVECHRQFVSRVIPANASNPQDQQLAPNLIKSA